jgi:hypothetical protein
LVGEAVEGGGANVGCGTKSVKSFQDVRASYARSRRGRCAAETDLITVCCFPGFPVKAGRAASID